MRNRELSRDARLETFGPGPWLDEPDSAEFTAHGLVCRIVRHDVMGFLCGYAGVPQSHPLYGLDYDDPLLEDVYAHGGLTFSGEDDGLWWYGFDCGHAWDLAPAGRLFRARLEQLEPEMHAAIKRLEDSIPAEIRRAAEDVYRDFEYVRGECTSLALQLQALSGLRVNSWTYCRGCKAMRNVRLVELHCGGSVQLCGGCRIALKEETRVRVMREMAEGLPAMRRRTMRELQKLGSQDNDSQQWD